MKNLFILGAILCGTLFSSFAFTQDIAQGVNGQEACCPQDHPCEGQPTGECWCLYTRYESVTCDKWRCVEEPIHYKRKCCRQVPKYYEVQKCRYVQVPQYYTETCCKYEPEYYEVDECKTCKKYVCDKEVKYVPKYYWKHVCGNSQSCDTPCPQR